MKLVFRLVGVILLLGLMVLLFISIPVSRDILVCYDRSTESFDDVEARTRIRGWSEEYRCTLRQGTIIALETCIEDRFEDPIIPDFMKDKILRTLEAVRPDVSSIGNIKLDHNNICQDYPDVLFIVEDHF